MASHILWIKWIARDHDPYRGEGLSLDYYYIDAATDLKPYQRHIYRYGSELLGVAVDDKTGARLIFEKGMGYFPNYWPIQYSAAYHYMEELKEPEKAANLLKKAHQNGGPDWLLSLAGKLYSESGQKELAKNTLKSYLKRYPEGKARDRVLERLKKLETQP